MELMKALTHEWGFIVVCTATTFTVDQLAAAFTNLRTIVLANQDSSAEMGPGTLVLPLMPSSDISAARATFNNWITAYDDTNEEWDSDVLRDVFIILNDAAVESLLAVGGSTGEPWVVVVDAKYAQSGRARQDYTGYMRCLIRSLWTRSDELQNGDQGLEALSPARQYADQISLFDGSPREKVLEPEQPSKGMRIKFSRGTQRGGTGGTQRGV